MKTRNHLLMEAKNLSKSFGKVNAVKDVSFKLGYGEILGLLGDNGAGKSTLVKIIIGLYPPDTGDIYYKGENIHFSSPAKARDKGIEIVYQNLGLIDLMNIRQNFYLAKEITKKLFFFEFLNNKKMDHDCKKSLDLLGIKLRSTDEDVSLLSGGERQSICIARSMYFGVDLLILDEPTAALSIKETNKVLEHIEKAKQKNISIIFISHNVYHVHSVADKFMLLDHGAKIGEFKKENVSPDDLIHIISEGKILPKLEKFNMTM